MTTDNKQPETADVLTSCPRCGCVWGDKEIMLATCFACGYDDSWEDLRGDVLLCPVCGGTGVDDPNFDGWDDEGWLPCEACNGTGLMEIK